MSSSGRYLNWTEVNIRCLAGVIAQRSLWPDVVLLILSPGASAGVKLDLESRTWDSAHCCYLLILAVTCHHGAAHSDWLLQHMWRLVMKNYGHGWCVFLHKKYRDKNHTHSPIHLYGPLIGKHIVSLRLDKLPIWYNNKSKLIYTLIILLTFPKH